jgi:hypothetical protein
LLSAVTSAALPIAPGVSARVKLSPMKRPSGPNNCPRKLYWLAPYSTQLTSRLPEESKVVSAVIAR